MDRRNFLAAAGAAALVTSSPLRAQSPQLAVKTRWVVRTSEGFDALGFLGPLSGDPFYADHYPKEIAAFAPRLSPQLLADIRRLRKEVGDKGEMLSPALYLYFSGSLDATLDDLFASIERPERLRPAIEASPYWDADDWQNFIARLPRVKLMLEALRDAGFRQFRNGLVAPQAAAKLPALRTKLTTFDVLHWAEFYTGRQFDPTIEVIFMHFNKPHGIKIIGQRFLTGLAYRDAITIQTAAHEVLHPPIRMDGDTATSVLAILEKDALLNRIVAERDKSYYYGSVRGLFDEGLTEALDHLIGDRLGVRRDPRERWRKHDGGMHIFAAAMYGMMQADGFARTGGNLEHWLARKAKSGALAPPSLHSAAAKVLGYRSDRLWPPPKPAA